MLAKAILSALLFSGLAVAQYSDSSVVGVFVLARHGDRTSKIEGIGIEGSSVLTTLGKNQVYAVGQYLRNKYLNSTSPDYIQNISSNYVASQFYVSAPYVPFYFSAHGLEMTKSLDCRQLDTCKAFIPRLRPLPLKLSLMGPLKTIH